MELSYKNEDEETGVGNNVIIRALSNTTYHYTDVPFVAWAMNGVSELR